MRGLPGLATESLGRFYLHLDTVGSTNDYLKENAHLLPHGAAVTASRQTMGKGRMGKTWNGERDRGLALSVLLHHWKPQELSLLPLLAGIAVCRGIRRLCGAQCGVKWSNDILLEDRKLCGILCESQIQPSGDGFAVVGMGVNLLQTGEEFSRLGLVYATSLFLATKKSYAAADAAAAILNQLEPLLEQFSASGFAPLRAEYRSLCVTLGRQVRVVCQGGEQVGAALDIADDGSLLCNIGGKILPISAGEASVRGLYGYA